MSKQLKEIQNLFLKKINGAISDEASLDLSLKGAGTLSQIDALRVYRQDYILRLTEVLGDQYSACWKVVGDDDFLRACESYIHENPSSFKSLSLYGNDFPYFLDQRLREDYPFILQLGLYERSFYQLFHCRPREKQDLQEALSEYMSSPLMKREDAQIFISEVDLSFIWDHKDDETEMTWDMIDREGCFFLYKEGYAVKRDFLPLEYLPLLKEIDKGICIGEILEQMSEEGQDQLQALSDLEWANFFKLIIATYRVIIRKDT
ncbi:MAG: hypothetical protein CME63_09515 [Halobacteriovoraceae bacterium]|nr:hypothetical protein [Halobacteriovoraceae bacterium]MBC97975.1 hypothetical protein [Halobacteriovoraceae bacterium]|tara:strand:+ start:181519 stop:182304 length:786 start_codon:yes stop_codon:yes gene_type:complete